MVQTEENEVLFHRAQILNYHSSPFKDPCLRMSQRSRLLLCNSQLLGPTYCHAKFFKAEAGSHPLVGNRQPMADSSPRTPLEGSPPGYWCHSLTDRYKVTTMCSEVLNLPLSLSCPSTMPRLSHPLDPPLCVLIESRHKLEPCTLAVIENMWLKKKRRRSATLNIALSNTSQVCESWYRHETSSLWGLKRPLCRC